MAAVTCQEDGCTRKVLARQLCGMHYQRAAKVGFPVVTADERFWDKVDFTPTCWLWTKALSSGYGTFSPGDLGPKTVYAHRYAYEMLVGPIPAGLVLDHLCRVTRCLNPMHLEPVTNGENVRRGNATCRERCRQGHEYTEANTLIVPDGRRQCRACNRERYLRRVA